MADHYQPMTNTLGRKGQILVAHPNLRDRMFTRSVVLIVEDSESGTIGLVVNKPSDFPVNKFFALKGHETNYSPKDMVRCAGPVNPQAITMIHDDDWYSSNTYVLQRGLAVSSDEFMLEKMMTGNEPRYWRMYTGMAGWAPGQLDAEINGTFPYQSYNGWLTYPGDRATIFRYDEEQQWEKALEQCTMQAIDSWF